MLELFGFFSQLWDVSFQETFAGAIFIGVDSAVCLVGASLSIIVIALIPIDVAKLFAYSQRIAIALVGTALFSIFIGHLFGQYPAIRIIEFIMHMTATLSLLTGALLRAQVRHTLRALVEAMPAVKLPWEK